MSEGSGYAKYWYSPRPNPCRPITPRLRKILSFGYNSASASHSSEASRPSSIAHPWESSSRVAWSQSSARTRSLAVRSACLADTLIRLLSIGHDLTPGRLAPLGERRVPVLALEFRDHSTARETSLRISTYRLSVAHRF